MSKLSLNVPIQHEQGIIEIGTEYKWDSDRNAYVLKVSGKVESVITQDDIDANPSNFTIEA